MTRAESAVQVLLIAPSAAAAGGGQAKAGRLLLEARYDRLCLHHIEVPHADNVSRLWRIAESIRMSAAAIHLVRRNRIRVVHIFTPCSRMGLYEKLWLMLICRFGGAATVFNFRGEFDLAFERLTRMERAAVRVALRQSTVVLCQYRRLANYVVANRLARDSTCVRVLPNAIDLREMRDRGVPRAVGQDGTRILFIGAAIPGKGLDLLLRALAHVAEIRPDANWRLDVYGRGHPTALDGGFLARAAAGVRSQVHFHGHVHSAARLRAFEEADVFVLPSRTEGFPNTLLEALAAGLAVIAADAGAVRELVRDGHDGLVVPRDDVSALTAALLRLIQDPPLRAQLSAAAVRTARRYDVESVTGQFEDLYLSLAATNP